jgi:hypothetical protein
MNYKVVIKLFVVFMLWVMAISCSSSGQTSAAQKASITNAIDSGNWIFTVTNFTPQGGRTSQPNGVYTVSYSSQTLQVNLPYFGRAYSGADIIGGQSPLNFVSTDITVGKQLLKNDNWRILLKIADQPQVQSMNFEIFDNGSATLNVILTNRSPISYGGILRENSSRR